MNNKYLKEKKEFEKQFRGKLYGQVKNPNYIRPGGDKYAWVTCDEDVWTWIASLLTRQKKELIEEILKRLPEEDNRVESPQMTYADTNPGVAYELGRIDGHNLTISEVRKIIEKL